MPDGARPKTLLARLMADDDVADAEVEAHYPGWIAALSEVHWTPVAVARRAAAFLTEGRGRAARVLDVGSGAGKFCAIGAACTGATFVGVERNPRLVEVADALVASLGVATAEFHCAAMERFDWSSFDGVYFYNPFGEQFVLDADVMVPGEPRGWPVYVHHLRTALAKLYLMPAGTRVATFHGLGAWLPPGYEVVERHFIRDGVLRCYVRRDPLTVVPPRPLRDFLDSSDLFDDPTDSLGLPVRGA